MVKNKIVVDGVTYYAEPPDLSKAKVVIEKLEWLRKDVAIKLMNAQILHNESAKNGLTISAISTEGYLRAIIDVMATIERIDDSDWEHDAD